MKTNGGEVVAVIDYYVTAVYQTKGGGWFEETTARQNLIEEVAAEILKAYEGRR